MGSDPINPAGDVLTHWEEASRLKGFGNGRVLPLVPPLARRAAREPPRNAVVKPDQDVVHGLRQDP